MARLNDLPGPTESVEALKRRFIRQNREIARVNSLQSLRIQSLESELSHLMKENAALKEQIISLTQDAEKYEAGRAFHKDIYRCKEKLAAKVSELNSLIGDLGLLPERFLKRTAHLETESNDAENQRPSDTNRRPITWNENDDRLPTILEDKYFPRQTLDPEELAETPQDIDSPSIGSPPIAHFDVDQSPFSRTKTLNFLSTKDLNSPDLEGSNDSLPVSPNDMNNEEVPITEQSPSPVKSVSLPVLSGSKRKFSATEDEVRFSPLPATNTTTIDDGFQFTRATDISRVHRPNVAVEIVGETKKHQKKDSNVVKRKVLEPKTTNMASSKKLQVGETVQKPDRGKPKEIKEIQGKDRKLHRIEPLENVLETKPGHTRKTKRTITVLPSHEDDHIKPLSDDLDSVDQEYRQRSFNANEPAVMDSMPLPGLGSRPSRRARGAISYAEPNLRDKMRRATNELVDAVIPGNDRRTSTSLPATSDPQQESERPTLINTPEEHGSSAKKRNAVSSDLHNNQGLAELPRHLVTERKRRTLSASTNEITVQDNSESEPDHSALSDLSAKNNKITTAQGHPRRRSANPSSQSRRHSSNPGANDGAKLSQIDKTSSYHDPYETSEVESDYHDDTFEEESLPQSTTTKDIREATGRARATRTPVEDGGNSQTKRGQRASSRRRSMLL